MLLWHNSFKKTMLWVSSETLCWQSHASDEQISKQARYILCQLYIHGTKVLWITWLTSYSIPMWEAHYTLGCLWVGFPRFGQSFPLIYRQGRRLLPQSVHLGDGVEFVSWDCNLNESTCSRFWKQQNKIGLRIAEMWMTIKLNL